MKGFVKKMCILKQMKSGYSADGNALGGLVKAEQYGNLLKCEVSLIDFAPLIEGNYCCVVSDRAGRTASFPLQTEGGKFSSSTEADISSGFLAVICYVDHSDYCAVAYGVNGEHVYDIGSLLIRLFDIKIKSSFEGGKKYREEGQKAKEYLFNEREPPRSSQREENKKQAVAEDKKGAEEEKKNPFVEKEGNSSPPQPSVYNDEKVADENYYAFSSDGQEKENLESDSILRAFRICGGDTYYRSVRSELDEIFKENPIDDSLRRIFPHSMWIRLREGEDRGNLVGIIHEHMVVRYVCYAVFDDGKVSDDVKEKSCFVPVTFFKNEKRGYYVIFRDADTGGYAKVYEE